jgi:hypothetical protein
VGRLNSGECETHGCCGKVHTNTRVCLCIGLYEMTGPPVCELRVDAAHMRRSLFCFGAFCSALIAPLCFFMRAQLCLEVSAYRTAHASPFQSVAPGWLCVGFVELTNVPAGACGPRENPSQHKKVAQGVVCLMWCVCGPSAAALIPPLCFFMRVQLYLEVIAYRTAHASCGSAAPSSGDCVPLLTEQL